MRELPRNALARRGLLVLVALAVVGALISLRGNGTFGQAPHATAVVETAGGALRPGSDVKLNGVLVGRVSSIGAAEGGGVKIDMEFSEEDMQHVPDNVVARILPATVFGTTFVDLVVHGEPSDENLQAGDVIEADRTQGTLEVQQALDDIDRLVNALGPAELASAIGSAAQALDGRGGQLARTVATLNGYLDRLNPRMPQLRANLVALAANVRLVDEVAPDLLAATEDGLVFLDTLVTQEAALTRLMSGGTSLAQEATGFLARNQRELVAFINDTGALVDAVYDNRRAGITDAISANLLFGREIGTIVEHGFTLTAGHLRTSRAGYYGAASRPSYRDASPRLGVGALTEERE